MDVTLRYNDSPCMMTILKNLHMRVPVQEDLKPHCPRGEVSGTSRPQLLSGDLDGVWASEDQGQLRASSDGLRKSARFSSPGPRLHWFLGLPHWSPRDVSVSRLLVL